MQRQRPQIEALKKAGAPVLWGEAFRYVDEAFAVARVARNIGFQALAICFEANTNGMPDPTAQGLLFRELKWDLQKDVGRRMRVYVGANCTGVSNIRGIWRRGDKIDIAYPNALNIGDKECYEFGQLVEKRNPTAEDLKRIGIMKKLFDTSLSEWVSFYRDAFNEHGVLVAGGCCGTTPEHTRVARWAYNEAHDNRRKSR